MSLKISNWKSVKGGASCEINFFLHFLFILSEIHLLSQEYIPKVLNSRESSKGP